MKRRTLLQALPAAALFPGSLWAAARTSSLATTTLAGNAAQQENSNPKPASTVVHELRVYHVAPGKLGELLARFRDHTIKLFARHGIKSIAYWTPADEPQKSNTLVYILEHPSREAATANWNSFREDSEWKSVKEKSEANGNLVEKVDSTYLVLTDFSPPLR